MELHQLSSLDPDAFKQLLEEDYFDLNGIYIIEVYNALMHGVLETPAQIARLAEVAVEVYTAQGREEETILYLELQARALLYGKDFHQAMQLINRIADMQHGMSEQTVVELAQDIISSMDTYGISIDQRPRIMSTIVSTLERYGQQEEIAYLYLDAAELYSRHGASSAAYRCASDAEEIAVTLQSMQLMARCATTVMIIACEENNYEYGLKAGRQALSLYDMLEEEAPPLLLSNMGVAYMNLEDADLELASGYFEDALKATDLPDHQQISIRANLSICLRRCDQMLEAEEVLSSAEMTLKQDDENPEGTLELYLSGAKLAAARQDIPLLTRRLREASHGLDRILVDVLRLHHRRGIRERYITRIEGLLRELPSAGNASDALLPIVASRGNAMGDWLTILTWATRFREIRQENQRIVDQLDTALQSIRDIGAPHLFGLSEKWDDAWSQRNSAQVWDDLSQAGALINAQGGGRPLDLATTQHQSNLCLTRLTQGHCLMVMTYAGMSALLWYFVGDQYKRIEIPLQALSTWHKAQLSHAQFFIDRGTFQSALHDLIQTLSPLLDPVFKEIANAGCKSVRFIEDCYNDLPLMEFALRNAQLAGRMLEGEFQVRMVPAFVEPETPPEQPISSPVSIIDPRGDLRLAPYEADAFTKAAGLPSAALLHTDGEGNLGSLMGEYDTLIVSTHGHSLQFFTDAYFAHLGNPDQPHLIKVSSLQRAAPDLSLRLALLNTCYSGSRSPRNYQKSFRTSDSVAIPNLFLLNRQAVALAGAWKVFDIVSFSISYLVGEGLRLGFEPSAALARAIARVRVITRSTVETMLKDSLPHEAQEEALATIKNAPEVGMFAAPYNSAGLAIHGLL
ncbi:hypothetical protein ACIGCH_15665 [Pseudomonas helleri]|uniref:hypothetical protein n=1 Tax=Pseudomonas helleri TaxID=1608996 RepID=UPI0037C96FF0